MNYSDLHLPVMESHVDWLTCSAKRGERADLLCSLAEGRVLDNRDHGDKLTDWSFQGYRGWMCGDARWGWGLHGALAVFSADAANDYVATAAVRADHWSRIDYATTVFDYQELIHPDEDYYDHWLRLHSNGRGPTSLARHQTAGGGGTLVLGSRASSRYTRVYDKHKESKGVWPPGSWRFECELKREQSEAAQSSWRQTIHPAEFITAMAVAHLQDYKLPIPFDVAEHPHFKGIPPRERDSAKALEWLRTQVAPTVEWLCQAVGSKEVRRALNV